MRIPIQMLGQSGIRMNINSTIIYIDPYLSNSVAEFDSKDLERLLPIPMLPDSITDADWILVTHEHIDHCDPHTLPKLARVSSHVKFMGPSSVLDILREWQIEESRLHLATENWIKLSKDLSVKAVPAAHPKIEYTKEGTWRFIGFILRVQDKNIYISGDTSPCHELIEYLSQEDIHTAFLPVNEINYFKSRRGIIGNMSIREAFELARELRIQQVVPVHWDMFSINAVYPEEIHLVYERLKYDFRLMLNPTSISLINPKISIIIRTLNEERYLQKLLESIYDQEVGDLGLEVVLIDSGSTDKTLQIAQQFNCHILHITREEFSFGRSLNRACEVAVGDILVMISGHCIPKDKYWLQNLCQPLLDGKAQYAYGKQLGGDDSQFSEIQIFEKYFADSSAIPQEDFYCNNANAALLKIFWEKYKFDENLTGLEDFDLAKKLVIDGGRVAYIANAGVYHLHHESWDQVSRRFEREAIALQTIMPEVHVSLLDTGRYIASSILSDVRIAKRQGVLIKEFKNIVLYRCNQYIGSYKGNHKHRILSHRQKEKYFYPNIKKLS
ncbi:MAG: MBL fold metallo-hydrolase [Moraxella sp.]|nr:MBL fold metallo-hydrolase [Moraxella sp.]